MRENPKHSLMRRIALLALLLFTTLGSAARAQLQGGIVVDRAFTELTHRWTTSPKAVERLYCVTRWAADPQGFVYVLKIEPPIEQFDSSTAYGVSARCLAPTAPIVHTHTPNTCDWVAKGVDYAPVRCTAGGIDAYECWPSAQDRRTLLERGAPFDIVQCDRHAFVFYFNPALRSLPDSTPE